MFWGELNNMPSNQETTSIRILKTDKDKLIDMRNKKQPGIADVISALLSEKDTE